MLRFIFVFISISVQASVFTIKTPDDGLSPQCVTDSSGLTHMIYYKGELDAGDIYYTTFDMKVKKFKPGVKVNTIPNSASVKNTIKHPQLTVGKNGVAHIIWNSPDNVGSQLFYSRLLANGSFTPQLDLKGNTNDLKGGSSIAANNKGYVYIVWHANDSMNKLKGRNVFLKISKDNGLTFSKEKAISPKTVSACECCSIKASAKNEEVMVVFKRFEPGTRGASKFTRDIYQLHSKDRGRSFNSLKLYDLIEANCSGTSQTIFPGSKTFLRGFEARGRMKILIDRGKPKGPIIFDKVIKNPLLLQNKIGKILAVFSTDKNANGATLNWETLRADGQISMESFKNNTSKGSINAGVKTNSTYTGFVVGNDFVIVH